MGLTTRDRVGVDLRGIGDAVRAAAPARHNTVAAFAREALVEALSRPSKFPEVIAAEFGRAEIVKLTLRLREPEAEALILNATARAAWHQSITGDDAIDTAQRAGDRTIGQTDEVVSSPPDGLGGRPPKNRLPEPASLGAQRAASRVRLRWAAPALDPDR